MAMKCSSRTVVVVVVVVESVLYTTPDDGIQTTRAKLIYRTLFACSRNIWNFRSKMTIKHNNVSAELRVAEKAIA
jgi:hypothetical protein